MEEVDIGIHPHKEDKVHLIQVPKGFDISKLNGVEYNPGQVVEIEANQGTNGLVTVYELGAFDGQTMDLNLLVKSDDRTIKEGHSTIKAGPSLRQNLYVNKSVRLDLSANRSARKELKLLAGPVSFPEGLRPRFSPFGSGNAISCKEKGKSKSKRKRSHVSSEDTTSPNRRKKRHKHSKEEFSKDDLSPSEFPQNRSMEDDIDAGALATNKVKKHKKRKHKSSDSYRENEEDLSSIIADDKLVNGFSFAGDDVSADIAKPSKHKSKSHVFRDSLVMDKSGDASSCSVLENNCAMDEDIQKRKKKKRNSSHLTVSSADDSLDMESGQIVVKEKRKKTKKTS